jgi:hypothetical protein
LFPGLVPTPTKTKTKHKSKVNPKALKLAIDQVGLTNKLNHEALTKAPLQPEMIQKICGFVSLQTIEDSAYSVPQHTVEPPQQVVKPPRLTLQDLDFPPSDDENDMDCDNTLEGININDLNPNTEDEDLLDEFEDTTVPGRKD